MNLRLYNARILTMERDREIFPGEIWIKNEKIAYVAPKEEIDREWKGQEMPRIDWDLEIDCQDNLLMPGFKDAHTHSGMTLLRSLADGLPTGRWLKEKVFPVEERLTQEDIYYLTKLAVLEYLSGGITSIFDMYLKPEAAAEACIDLGMRCVLVSGLNDFTSSVSQVEEEYLKWNRRNPLISYQIGFHGEYTSSPGLLAELASLVHHYRAPVYTHLAETAGEVKECRERTGLTPAMYLDSLGLFDFGGGAYHCVHMTREDMEVFRRRRLYMITCPASNAKLASGVAPYRDFWDSRVGMAIGTDGPASNNALDMFREMFLVAALSNLREMDPASIDPLEVLRMATVNGAKAMRLGRADVLAKGKLADIVMLDMSQPNMQPEHNIPANLVYSGSKANVKMTVVGGRVLYHDGRFFVGEDPEGIYRQCRRVAGRVLQGI